MIPLHTVLHMVPIKKELKRILASIKDQHGFVIQNVHSPDEPITETAYQRLWERISKKIDLHGATLHCFRHTYATMTEAHTDAVTLMSVLGHADPKTTRRYTHVIPDNVRKLAEVDIFVTQDKRESP